MTELQIEKFFPGVQGLGFSLLIPAAELENHQAKIRAEGFPDYLIQPAGERRIYTAIIYLEPFNERNLRAFGFDMYSEAVRHKAMDTAWRENQITLSGKVRLIQENGLDVQTGFLMYLPVYRNGADISDVNKRWANLQGWVYAPFRMNDFMAAVLEEVPELKLNLDVDVYDDKQMSADTLLYDQHNDGLMNEYTLFSTLKTIEIDLHSWTLHIHAHNGFETKIDYSTASYTLVIGVAISLMLTLISSLLVHGRKRAYQLARRMNAELLERQMRYEQMFEGSSSIALLIDPQTGQIIDVNPAASQFWGYSIEQLRSMNISDINTMPLAQILQIFQQILRNAQHLYAQHRLSNGEVRDVELYTNAIVYQGRLVIHEIVHDITERKKLELEKEQFATFFRLAPDFQCIANTQGFFYQNQSDF